MYLSKQMTKSGFSSKIGRIPTKSILGDPGTDSGDEGKSKRAFWVLIGARTAATVWNWSGKTFSPGVLLAVLYFSSCHIFPPV